MSIAHGKMKNLLLSEAEKLGVQLSDAAAEKMFAYKDFVLEYSKKVNLTAITSDEDFIVKHFLDSLSVLPHLAVKDGTRIIDVGTGAGFPGVVLKLANDKIDLMLLDSLNKRIKFLMEAVVLLGLQDVECVHARAEEILKQRSELKGAFDYAVARAVTKLPKLTAYCLPFVKNGGEFIAMKGRNYHEELAEAKNTIRRLGGELVDVKKIILPNIGDDEEIGHNLVIIKKVRV